MVTEEGGRGREGEGGGSGREGENAGGTRINRQYLTITGKGAKTLNKTWSCAGRRKCVWSGTPVVVVVVIVVGEDEGSTTREE